MAEPKTKPTNQNPKDFLSSIEPEQKKQDSLVLLEMFEKITRGKAIMWGTNIVGFGMYHYKSERSKQEGDWPLTAFSPRKQNLTLYILSGIKDNQMLEKLGKYKASGGCLHIKRMADVDQKVLETLIEKSFYHRKNMNK